ncbi:putative dimethylaniline monooxygenase [Microdochium bolleyi]|uniref:Putative dimethylaniline monooxygenase n=1 Tax=Microdochium bolleyi TaxID=196109 RepID=A0A136ITX2_9PEZI|nr:putative dimethylaniline monooxygenase [Microdochium bolleyi]
MAQQTVAVIGAGSSGLSMLKTLREDGFKVTLYERRKEVGGLWAYTDDKGMTTALRSTTANISKYTCGMSDFPMPDKYSIHMDTWEFQEYMESYAKHFDLLKDIVFGAWVKKAVRNDTDTKWRLEFEINGELLAEEFDKVAFCHGYQTTPNRRHFEGEDSFKGLQMHAQQYRSAEEFRDKKVVVLGLGPTAADIISELVPVASKVYTSHRRGAFLFPRFNNGTPSDLIVNWQRRQMGFALQRMFPNLARRLGDFALKTMMRKQYGKFDPAWRLEPFPSISLSLAGTSDVVLKLLRDGSLTTLPGLKRFSGPRTLEFVDGTTIEDVDAVIHATGYSADFSVTPWLQTSHPPASAGEYGGADLVRLWMNMFPPQYADSMVLLCHSAYGKNNGFSFSDVTSMAVSNIWRGVHLLPSPAELQRDIDEHHAWVASRWRLDNQINTSMVKNYEFQGFLHDAAGTGMREGLGWGWEGWKFWWKDRELSWLMSHGVETAHAFRVFETGKRRTWPGAREAILHANETTKIFPLKGEEAKKLK